MNVRRILAAAAIGSSALVGAGTQPAQADCVPFRVEQPAAGLGVCYGIGAPRTGCVTVIVYHRNPVTGAGSTGGTHCV